MNGLKYVFVCGLQRSGTTVLAHNIGKMKDCTGFENTGVVMDEGQYLQDIYPLESAFGGVGKFGFAPQAHLTEESSLLTPANVSRLHQSWEVHWERDKTIRVEKTPSNLLKTRFLQAAFPNAYFIVIKRHPVPVSLASQKWSQTPLHNLFEHWLRCHEIFDGDKERLTRLYEVSYEDFVRNPKKQLSAIAYFLGTEPSDSLGSEVTDVYDKQYFARWDQMLRSSRFKSYYRCVARMYERKFREHGCSVAPLSPGVAFSSNGDEPIRRNVARLLYLGADIHSVLWRAEMRLRRAAHPIVCRWYPKRVRTTLHDLSAQTHQKTSNIWTGSKKLGSHG